MAFIGHTIPARTFKFKTHTNVSQVREAKVHTLVSNPAHLRVPHPHVPSRDQLAGRNSRYSVTACPPLVKDELTYSGPERNMEFIGMRKDESPDGQRGL